MGKYKLLKIIGGILIILSILSVGTSIYSIYLLKGIETFYRIMFSIFMVLLLILLLYTLIDSIKFNKKKKFIITGILTFLLTIISVAIAVVIFVVYSKLDNMTASTKEKYKTVLISLEEQKDIKDLKDLTIGIVNNEEDIEGYILPGEVISKYKLKSTNKIKEYDDTLTLMQALLNKEVDAIFIGHNYEGRFLNLENFDQKTKFYEIYDYEKEYEKEEEEEDTEVTKITDPFTILLLGVDSEEDELKSTASFNGDTIMLVAVDPETLHATMFSIPRDTYVPMACGGGTTKITHAAWGGTNCVVKTVENLTGIKINYYMKINFRGVVDLVDKLGGITVDVPVQFCESNSHRWTGKEWQICLNPGVQTLNGEQALALSRHRKTLPLGDFQRGQNQQLVVEAMLNKLKTLRSVDDFYAVLNTISKNIETNMSVDKMLSFYNVGKSILMKDDDVQLNITKTFLTGYDLYVWEGYMELYTFQYYRQSLADIVDAMKINLRQKSAPIIKTFSFSINKKYEKEIVGQTYYSETREELIPYFTANSLAWAQSWAAARGFTITVKEQESSDPQYSDGQIIAQSVHGHVLVSKASKNITLTVIKKVEAPTDPSEEDPTDPGEVTPPEEEVPGGPTTGGSSGEESGGESSGETGDTGNTGGSEGSTGGSTDTPDPGGE